jgi:hypothetical protein
MKREQRQICLQIQNNKGELCAGVLFHIMMTVLDNFMLAISKLLE